ncbi:hypothetical protein GGI20_001345 [Coemansia sp. BCRC 34301]|nr:hypothetical protein GGI20_001345 [Coemansia sp. BCRC 34301]
MRSAADVNSVDERIRGTLPPGTLYASRFNELNTLSERRIRQMSSAVRAEPNWIQKLQSVEIRDRWRAEAKAQSLTGLEVDYVFVELGFYASLHSSDTSIVLSAVDGVWCSDSLVDTETAQALKDYAVILEDVPAREKDFCPDSNDQVLNLVDPSLYPLVYKRSSMLLEPIASPLAAVDLKSFGTFPSTREGWSKALNSMLDTRRQIYLADTASNCFVNMFRSEMFCWLPAEFRVDSDGTTTVESYINNLHPRKHAALYLTIGAIFSKFVPMLEQVVTDLVHPRSQRVVAESHNWFRSDKDEPEDTWVEGFDERYEQWKEDRIFIDPQPEPFVIPDRPTTPYCLRGRRLQGIVKMSNIELTPVKPKYEDDAWHIEAMANERIIATGIYYYDVENIAESSLKFRERVGEEIDNEPDDWRGVSLAYGIKEDDIDDDYDGVPLSQEIGHIEIKNGRCIMFPNIYQHQTSGFKLADSSRPGHCKMLVFYFVDPATRIPSTEVVPPQQQSWWAESFMSTGPLSDLPLLVKEGILDNVHFPMSLKMAKELRLKLMAEHDEANKYASNELFTVTLGTNCTKTLYT